MKLIRQRTVGSLGSIFMLKLAIALNKGKNTVRSNLIQPVMQPSCNIYNEVIDKYSNKLSCCCFMK